MTESACGVGRCANGRSHSTSSHHLTHKDKTMQHHPNHLTHKDRICQHHLFISTLKITGTEEMLIKIIHTCAWTPNKVFIHFLLVSVETARVLLQSWWARLSTGASREAPVDNECLGKCRQVGGSGESWNMSYWQLG